MSQESEANSEQTIRLRRIYPDLSEDELEQVAETLDRYISLVCRIYERMRNDPEAYARLKALTASREPPTMEGPRQS